MFIDAMLLLPARVAALRRRVDLGIQQGESVLDVGSGHLPHPRADVLCERYLTDNRERSGEAVRDRPLVVGDIQALPFRDKAFDFVIAQHVLEHVPDIKLACAELSRVGRRGYVETPSPLWERLLGRSYHLWYVASRGGGLEARAKASLPLDDDLVSEFRKQFESSSLWSRIMLGNFDRFYTSIRWKGQVECVAIPPQPNRERPISVTSDDENPGLPRSRLAQLLRGLLYAGLRWTLRPRRNLEIWPLLACPKCKQGIRREGEELICDSCGLSYPIRSGVPMLVIEESRPIRSKIAG